MAHGVASLGAASVPARESLIRKIGMGGDLRGSFERRGRGWKTPLIEGRRAEDTCREEVGSRQGTGDHRGLQFERGVRR